MSQAFEAFEDPLSDEEKQLLAELPSPAFLDRVRKTLRGRHARENRLLAWFSLELPIGTVRIVHDGILVHLVTNTTRSFDEYLESHLGFEPAHRASQPVRTAVLEVLSGRRRGDTATYLDSLTPFQQSILRTTARIPRGEVRPYGWVAREAGSPGAVRAAGTALGHNPVPFVVPCHRVVRSDWRLGEYSAEGGPATKARVLESEGLDLELLAALPSSSPFVADSRSGTFHLPVCHAALAIPAPQRVGLRRTEDAIKQGFAPCPLCRPVSVV